MKLHINEDLRDLIPPLSIEERSTLEQSLISEGCRDAIVTWNGTIIDGHNRYELCTKNGIHFRTEEKQFDTIDDVKQWMIINQFGRRNLSAYQRSLLALELETLYRRKAKEKQIEAGGAVRQKSDKAAIDTKKELATIANVSHDTIAKVKVIKEKAPEEVKKKLETGELTIHGAYTEIKREEKKQILYEKKKEYQTLIQEKESSVSTDIFITEKKYRVIYADPAWSYNDKQDTPNLGGASKHYDTMSTDEICSLPVCKISENNAVLFLWVTSPLLEDGLRVIKEWGFKYKSSFIWDKVGHVMGHYNSVRHEFLFIATKGSCTPDEKILFDSVQSIEKSDKHSEKPIEFVKIIDQLYTHGERIELFCRTPHGENWDYWGNEI